MGLKEEIHEAGQGLLAHNSMAITLLQGIIDQYKSALPGGVKDDLEKAIADAKNENWTGASKWAGRAWQKCK